MSIEIQPTPILRGKDAEEFERRVAQDLKKRCKLVETPKLEEARRLVVEYCKEKEKEGR